MREYSATTTSCVEKLAAFQKSAFNWGAIAPTSISGGIGGYLGSDDSVLGGLLGAVAGKYGQRGAGQLMHELKVPGKWRLPLSIAAGLGTGYVTGKISKGIFGGAPKRAQEPVTVPQKTQKPQSLDQIVSVY